MNISASECSSRCESGWTTYLDHLSYSTNPYNQVKGAYVIEDEEDEDLSMVSDASSGPPHFLENYSTDSPCYYGCASPAQEERKKSKQKIRTRETRVMMKQQHSLCLDDTASSPVLHFSQESAVQYSTENFSQAFSTADFEEEATSKKNIAFFKPSMKGKSGSFLGRKRQ